MGGQTESSCHEYYSLFETPIGSFGIAWNERGLTRLHLPEADRGATERRLRTISTSPLPLDPPSRIARVIVKIQQYLDGRRVDFSSVSLDFGRVSPFHRKVYEAARSVGWGQTVSYGDLARIAGSPAAARAVGQALSRNPVAIIIPCHRILASGRRMGGFSAFGGTSVKESLLALEGVDLTARGGTRPPSPSAGTWDEEEAVRILCAADPVLAGAIRETGPFAMERRKEGTPFERLAEAVVHQQLTTKAAATILGRLKAALAGEWTPDAILRTDREVLRASGLSQAKATAVVELAAKTLDGTIPSLRSIRRMTDDEVVERLTSVKGIGVWTAQMFLIFSLRRPDVMPALDYGLRRGFQVVYRTPEVPTPAEVQAHAERWRPYRSVASWYLWRAADKAVVPGRSRSES